MLHFAMTPGEHRKYWYGRLYSEPQKITYVEPSERENRYFELYNMSSIFPMTPNDEEELVELENEEYTLSE